MREYGRRAGIALNPETPLEVLNEELLEQVDVVHLMTTCPGVEGQSFIPESMEKIALLRKRLDSFRPGMDLEVDGNITMKSIGRVAKAGANVLVSGRALVQGNMTENIRQMRNILQSPERGNVYEVCAGS
ncbi:MAG: hypothetical protein HFJ10_06000 [Lachnospiraceae bacterium]|nr:hypothetical protein [Lachnospiraceae bacterium]